ncbi:ATP-binding protein [Undibacterium pigrum]|uniref:ATP-binding protein n=1 Tax=Undibacterium pigrum TaxID=401470 RepID=UPI00147331C1|nr:ATP-binding protein [Undibacterium pigrum]
MNRNLHRIVKTARRHPRLATCLLSQLSLQAQAAGQTGLQLDACYQRYLILERLGQAHSMHNELEQGLQVAEQQQLTRPAGLMLLALGRISYTEGAYRDAILYWTRCVDLSKFNRDQVTLVEAHIGLGQIYDALGDRKTAARFHTDAGILLEQLNEPYLLCKQIINLGVNELNTGELQAAENCFLKAKALAEEHAIHEYLAETYWYLGLAASRNAQLALAETHIRTALQLAHACDYVWLEAATLDSLADILRAAGQTEDALAAYATALSYAEKIGSRSQKVRSLAALSELHEQQENWKEALHFARLHQQTTNELSELGTVDKFRELRAYDLSRKSPVEILLELSSNRLLEEGQQSEVLQLISDTALGILHAELVSVHLFDGNGIGLHCHARAGASCTAVRAEMPCQNLPLLMHILQQDEVPLVANDMRLHVVAGEMRALLGQQQLHSVLEIPLRLHGKSVGLLCFAQTSAIRHWSREDVLFGRHLANLIQQVLSHAEHSQTQKQLEARVMERTAALQLQTEQLQQAQQHIYQLSEIGREITSSLDRDTIMEIVYRHVHELMGAEVFAVGIYRPEQETIEFPCNILRGHRMLPYIRDIKDKDLLSVWCVSHQEPIFISDIYTEYQNYISVAGLNKLTVDSAYFADLEKIIPVSNIYVPLTIKGRTIGLIAIQSTHSHAFQRMHLDIAMMLAAYTAIAIENAETYQQLLKAQQILISQEKLAALGSLVAGIAHELNTPIGNSLLTATTLQEQSAIFLRKLTENSLKRSDLNQFSATINNANDLLLRNLMSASDLVSSFKQVSVDQTSQMRRTFNLRKTSLEVIRTLHNLIHKRGHTLEIDIPDDIELNSFPGPYGQILNNFINNAMLHAFDNRENGKMLLRAYKAPDNQVQLIFSDNGKGVEAQNLRRIFDPFFTTKLGQGGSGLGLSIVHNLVTTIMHGSITVDSTPGLGTRFCLSLPLNP